MTASVLRLPEKTKDEQRQGKLAWNALHCTSSPNFYTIGYSGRSIDEFISILKNAKVETVVDVRFAPVSRFKPEFSKSNLKLSLEDACIGYLHKPEWGVPRDIRAVCNGKPTRDDIWAWYDVNVLPNVVRRNLDDFFNSMVHPVAFMCVEYDPTECHRHRIFLGLERLGLVGCDL